MDYKEKVIALLNSQELTKEQKEKLEEIFPELEESEDEKVRKWLIGYFNQYIIDGMPQVFGNGLNVKDVIAWLEKQYEQKPTELPNGEDYGIDGLYAAIDILKKTLGKVDGYQTDDGILEHKCAISAVKSLYEQKPADKIQLGKKYKCIAPPRYSTFMRGEIYEPKDKFLCSLMNFLSGCFEPIEDGEQKHDELPKGEDYGIDSLWHAQIILEKTLGKVEGYQSDDGILEHKCAINAVKELHEQNPAWSE